MRDYIPKQHGAWAMLAIPFLFGMMAAGPDWIHGLLFAGWLLAYLMTYPLLQWVKTGHRRYIRPIVVYGSALLPIAAGLLIWWPGLARYALAFLPLFAVNCYFARIHRERSLVNDLAAVTMFSLMVFVTYDAGRGREWMLAVELFLLCVLYFTGTVFFVKTVIREKNNPVYYWISIGYHLAFFAAVAVFFPLPLLLPAAILLARSVREPMMKLSVKKIGILEIVYSVIIACFTTILYR